MENGQSKWKGEVRRFWFRQGDVRTGMTIWLIFPC